MLLGSRRCVPPTSSSNTISWLLQGFFEHASGMDVRFISQWDPALSGIGFDRSRYLHVMPHTTAWLRRVFGLIPYHFRKKLFGVADLESLAYFIGQALLVRRLKPDYVIVHVAFPLFRISRLLNPGFKHIFYFHSSNLADFSPPIIRDLYRHASGLVSICQVAIDDVTERFGSLPMPSVVIHNGVNTLLFNPEKVAERRLAFRWDHHIPEDAPVALYAGRIHPTKGVDKIVEACLTLRERYPGLVLLIAGDENFERAPDLEFGRALREHARARGGECIRFLGWIPYDQLPCIYAAADVSVLASLEIEGNPMFLLESMACGIPVVSTSVGGVPEVVRNGETGVLVEPEGDLAGHLVRALDGLLADPSRRMAMGVNAAGWVSDHFTPEIMTRKLEAYLNENWFNPAGDS